MTALEEFTCLGWCLLERKFVYYESPEGVQPDADSVYDQHEDRYRELAKELGMQPRVADAPGFPNWPSARLVASAVVERGLMPWPTKSQEG